MCGIRIRTVVGVDTDGDNDRNEIIVVGTVEDCSGLLVGLFSGLPPANAQASDAPVSRAATILAAGESAHGVTPTGNERVFTVTFTLNDTTNIKGQCGTVPGDLGLLAVCDDDDQCRDRILWGRPINCVGAGCPIITITADPSDECQGQTRSVALSLMANPFSNGLAAEVDFNDGTPSEAVTFSSVPVTADIVLGQAAHSHPYTVPGTGTTTFHVVVTIAGRRECVTTIDVPVDRCPATPEEPPPKGCPVDQVALVVIDSNGTDVTTQLEAGGCLPPGRYRVRANIVPAGATDVFAWFVGGVDAGAVAAVVGQRGVVAISDPDPTIPEPAIPELTIDVTEFRSVSVIAAGCASDGIDLRPCKEVCCPDLTGLSASCMPRCPPSTTVTLTATGTDIECAERFDWEFDDGTTAETAVPTTTHVYPSLTGFTAAVTIVRPRECGRPRTQRATAAVGPCPPSCFCAFLAIASGFLWLAFLTLMPLIACVPDLAVKQVLIVILIVVVILLAIAMGWWFIDACCRPTRCELARIMFWVFSWALLILAIIAFFCGAVIVIPFGVGYLIAQQIFLRMINEGECGPAPDLLSWPFPACS